MLDMLILRYLWKSELEPRPIALRREVAAGGLNLQVISTEMVFEAVRVDGFTRGACAVREEKRTKD